jgi:hypothetical protein
MITAYGVGEPVADNLFDTRVIYCGGNFYQLRKLPEGCADFI